MIEWALLIVVCVLLLSDTVWLNSLVLLSAMAWGAMLTKHQFNRK
jgi:hypothetical protein